MLADQVLKRTEPLLKQNTLNIAAREISDLRKAWEAELVKQADTSITAAWQYIVQSAASFDEAHDKSFFNEAEVVDLATAVGAKWGERLADARFMPSTKLQIVPLFAAFSPCCQN